MKMAFELQMLAVAVVIGLVHLVWAAASAQPQRGWKWNMGPREDRIQLTGMAGRLERAFVNFRETFPFFAAAVIVAYLGGRLGMFTYCGAGLYAGARALYILLYAFGVPVLRSLVWLVSMIGLGLILLALVI
ncbi:MAG: MAPEG family protein [Caulobacter sp.]|nr:MAPEG family protein [Caulobacter sp.]